MAKSTNMDTSSANLIQQGTEIKGDIITQGNIRIDGKLTGTLNCKGKLILGESGEIHGSVVCGSAEIHGSLYASIEVKELLSLKSSSKHVGDIVVKTLAIESGAFFSGNCTMSDGQNATKTTPPPFTSKSTVKK
ncbi:MAG: cell shape determination protein CcmA [Bacteroidetes bacterium]|nr:MAG: cell shape determination protein CcmA [Bacteroidota bacterium]PIE87693.1 MAG: cell shape determination protein CcmA [Bacteroidota bacterium]